MNGSGGSDVLTRILQSTHVDVERRRALVGPEELMRRLATRPTEAGMTEPGRPFAESLSRPGIGVIAEHKRRSPSAGVLREGADVAEIVGAYARAGASAISVLTEERHFDGSLEDLRDARAATRLPILRKDFIVGSYQLYEAAEAGADAVLLIVAALDPAELVRLGEQARSLGLETLVEVHHRAELAPALAVSDAVIGINNRDLRDFSVDVGRTFELRQAIPADRLVVSESGISRRGQLDELADAGIDAVLVGETLMRAPDPEAACRSLTAAS